jgi:uncharacterized phage protein (TIGR02218 family)
MRPVELYTIAKGASTWWLNNSVDSVVATATFTPTAGISRGDITNGEETLDIELPAEHAFPQLYVNSAPGTSATVTIQWLDRDDNPASLRVIYKGFVKSVSFSEDGQTASIHLDSVSTTFDKEIPSDTFSPQCQNFLYDEHCTVVKEDYDFPAANVSAIVGNVITVDGLFASHGAAWALPGYVLHDLSGELRQVLAQSGDDLTLIVPFTSAVPGNTVTVYAGCDHTYATCRDKFANDGGNNYRGCPHVPTKNLFATGLI